MNLNIKTKFKVGQEVYICKPDWPFIEGKYVMKYIPDPQPYNITSIRVHVYDNYTSIYYRLDGHPKSFKEKWVYESLDEATAACNQA